MKFARRRAGVLASAFLTTLFFSLTAPAQQPTATTAPAPAARKPYDPTRRVPPYFGQVGLTPEQKEQIYAINAKHQKKIEDAQKELARVRAEVLAECETVLNESQVKLLSIRREAAAAARKARAVQEPARREAGGEAGGEDRQAGGEDGEVREWNAKEVSGALRLL